MEYPKEDERVRIVLVISRALLERVTARAEKERRNRNNMLVVAVERGLDATAEREADHHAQSDR